MDRKLDEFLSTGISVKKPENVQKKRKRLKETRLDVFLPEEHINYFKWLRIGSKKIRNAKIEEL